MVDPHDRLVASADRLRVHLLQEPVPAPPHGQGFPVGPLVATAAAVGVIVVAALLASPGEPTAIEEPLSEPNIATTAPPAVPGNSGFVPPVEVRDDRSIVDVDFLDGSEATVSWPFDLDLTSEGVTAGGRIRIDGTADRPLVAIHGEATQLVGDSEVLAVFDDGDGEPVRLLRPEADYVDYFAFQFGSWAVLVYEYRLGGPSLMENQRRALVEGLGGIETDDGYLRLETRDGVELSGAGENPIPLVLVMAGNSGRIELVPGTCDPASERPRDSGLGAYAEWCDETGRMTVRALGSTEFVASIRESLVVESVSLAADEHQESDGATGVDVPREPPPLESVFQNDTDIVLLADDGIDGVTAIDLDRSIAARSTVDGQRAGDEPHSMAR